ncbi:UNVERIFIED_ORG: short-subunit dehydrogenase [Martelella mediterranea]
MTKSPDVQELIVVTGASSGIGAATAQEMARRGYHVLAGVRREQDARDIQGPNIEPVLIDITHPDDIAALAQRIDTDPPGRALRAVVNNAGIGTNAPVEVFDLDAWRKLFEVNYFGHIAVTQKLLPALLRSKGRVINISSVGGRIAMATYGPYAGAKFALEALSDSLRRELAPSGVDVVVIEPGAVQTKISGRAIAVANNVAAAMTPEQTERYGALIHAVTAQAAAADKTGAKASVAANVVVRAITSRRPRTRYGVGREAALLGLMSLLPDKVIDWLLTAVLRRYLPKAGAEEAKPLS